MQFNSIEFLFCFFPAFLAVYYLVPGKLRPAALTVGSLVFYGFASGGNTWWLLLLAEITLLAWIGGQLLAIHRDKRLLAALLGGMLAILSFYKVYASGRFLAAGMSFYLFQIAAYLIDVYREKLEPEKNFLSFGTQIMMFPKLLSGPLMDPRQLQLQQRDCRPDSGQFLNGLKTLIYGLGLKVVIANRLGSLWAQAAVVGYECISVPFAWLCLVGYAMQLYFDFYGYSLMAIGIGRMLGYELPENFLHPYISKTVSEFYRRWHATLGAWFREYLYIPLGGNRKGTFRTILNLAVVWLFTGLWHGVGGNYLVWAGFLFLLIVNERLWLGKILKKLPVIGHVYVVFVILLSWLPFAVGDFQQMIIYLGRLFGLGGEVLNPSDYILWGKDYASILAAGVVLATPLPAKICSRLKNTLLGDLLAFGLFWVVVYFLATAAQDPFLYFAY